MATAANSWVLSLIKRWHQTFVFSRRVRVLSEMFAARIPEQASVLDVGCGDGTIGSLVAQIRPDIAIRGVEVMVRSGSKIACDVFDGTTLPFADDSFDICVLADVLHHTADVTTLLFEAARVSRSHVLIKDHLDEGLWDDATLRFMDWVGNRPHGVKLTYNYQSRQQWSAHFAKCGLVVTNWTAQVPLYPWPASLFVGRTLHFVAILRKTKTIRLTRRKEDSVMVAV
jgi:SAM-dependent methyltransferase